MDFKEIISYMEMRFMLFIVAALILVIGWWVVNIVKSVIKFFKESK